MSSRSLEDRLKQTHWMLVASKDHSAAPDSAVGLASVVSVQAVPKSPVLLLKVL